MSNSLVDKLADLLLGGHVPQIVSIARCGEQESALLKPGHGVHRCVVTKFTNKATTCRLPEADDAVVASKRDQVAVWTKRDGLSLPGQDRRQLARDLPQSPRSARLPRRPTGRPRSGAGGAADVGAAIVQG